MLRVIGREDLQDDPRFVSRGSRVANMAAVDELLEGWTSQHPKDEIAQLMLKEGVPCAPVRELSEVIEDENMHARGRSEEHPSELQSLMRISYAVFCLKKKKHKISNTNNSKYILSEHTQRTYQ